MVAGGRPARNNAATGDATAGDAAAADAADGAAVGPPADDNVAGHAAGAAFRGREPAAKTSISPTE